ncbi:MAG TPA: pyrroline-5-carboxylate reductase [Bacteroidales bacterium]|nr:pyrroline-5-carboxylate reductase [Bacteroidales bacterium]
MNKSRIAILGGGNIGTAIAKGFIRSGIFSSEDITITRLTSQPTSDLMSLGVKVLYDNVEAIKDASYILLAVPPRQAEKLLQGLKGHLIAESQIIISVITAFSFSEIEGIIGEGFFIARIMPNTAIAVCESMTCLATNKPVDGRVTEVKEMFDRMGSTLIIEEDMMAASTILCSCGTAFMMRYIRAATQGGIQVGFHAEEAQLISAQVAKGAAALLLQNGEHPEQEIDKVTTPMGLTIKGLNEMEHNGLSSAVIKGIVHSFGEISGIK